MAHLGLSPIIESDTEDVELGYTPRWSWLSPSGSYASVGQRFKHWNSYHNSYIIAFEASKVTPTVHEINRTVQWKHEQTFIAFFAAISTASMWLLPIFSIVCNYEGISKIYLMTAMALAGIIGLIFSIRANMRMNEGRMPPNLFWQRYLDATSFFVLLMLIVFLPNL